MKAAFLQRFSCLKTNKQIYKLQQSENETGGQYLTRVQQLAMGVVDLSQSAIVDLAMNGLKESMRSYVMGREPKTYEELRRAIDVATNISESSKNNVNNDSKSDDKLTNMSKNDVNSMFASFY